mmetsp:Transcript_12493/g.12255  ORF Transcript_12493/g.12255 Transcript_12493/m.12255 type:complete len:92 (+) Transcript_12493:221-496(+)|eukprot:CAMPEP_0170556426 /NCGR_PEP_ID=MMETSP0211-20121228/16815_1 /TAXON_ID=311385 /ORGANISM="Pseudokeronopsis sp., Strain OXSARD2" /LENGTH=91 /DNA_ID=CAMNT_0010866755 /DNA_START=212 /DNA_END=487 /DNA_ORIENTATION=-
MTYDRFKLKFDPENENTHYLANWYIPFTFNEDSQQCEADTGDLGFNATSGDWVNYKDEDGQVVCAYYVALMNTDNDLEWEAVIWHKSAQIA